MNEPVHKMIQGLQRSFSIFDTIKSRLAGIEDHRYASNAIGNHVRLGRTVLEGDVSIANDVRFSGAIEIGSYTTIDTRSIFHGGEISIGRYCQIGPHVAIYAVNHATNYASIYNNRRLFSGKLKDIASFLPVHIGHDVWIGFGAIILPGVTIGNGAVIGAGSVVTKSVSPYSVAVGNPARVIKPRVPPELAELLQDWQWWQMRPEELAPYEELFLLDISQSAERAEQLLKGYLANDFRNSRVSTY